MYDIIIGRGEEDRKKFGTEGTILIGKHYVKMGQTTSLSNKLLMDVTRSHVVFICGKRGSGKCLAEDSLITLDNGLEIPIKELEEDKNSIFSIDDDFKIKKFQKTEFFKREVSKLLKIRLRSGREIKLTPEHPLLTINGWLAAHDLSIKSRIATPRKIGIFGKEEMSDSKVKVISYLIAEGHIKKPMLFSNSDEEIINDIKHSLPDIHPDLELTERKMHCFKINSRNINRTVLDYTIKRDNLGRMSKGSSISHEKTPVRKMLESLNIYGLLSADKFIPNKIMQLKKEKLSLFLNRLFSFDGSIYKPLKEKSYWEISYASSSEKMIRQVQSLLLRFGILSRLRNKKTKCNGKIFHTFELVLDGENVIKFIQEIGFFGSKNKKELIALKEMQKLSRNPNVDTIPKEVWDNYRPKSWAAVGKEFDYKTPKSLRSSIDYSPSRQKLLQIAKADNNERMQLLSESDIFWDEIISIERIEGNFIVYDITVPEAHNFIANNIIVHNSYSMGVIAEGMSDLPSEVKNNIAVVMLDTMGIYWTMKYPNKKDEKLLKEWNIEPKALDVHIYTPKGYYKEYKDQGIPTDFPFSIKPFELEASDWCMSFDISLNSEIGVTIERAINDLKEETTDYDIDDIVKKIKNMDNVEKKVIEAIENRFLSAKKWGLFDKEGTPIHDLVKGGQVTVMDVSCYATIPGASNIRALVIGLVSEKLFLDRMIARKKEEYDSIKKNTSLLEKSQEEKKKEPLVWLIVDEAHEFLPNEGETTATKPLITILREGRQPGISLILATQQPGKIHTDVMTQSDIVLAHRITANYDVTALGMLMQSYMREGLDKQLNYLPRVQGAAIIFDDSNEKMYPMRIRPRFTWHGGESPSAIEEKKKMFNF